MDGSSTPFTVVMSHQMMSYAVGTCKNALYNHPFPIDQLWPLAFHGITFK